jgi:hypothetical protein
VVIGNVVTTQLDAEDTLRMVGAAFGVRVKDLPKSELLMTLEAFFVNQVTQGKRCLLIVDEAQNLSARAVEELRMLSNFQFSNQSLLQTFLVGQPEFRAILQKPEMEQFRQRVAATCHIGPLDEDETQRYMEHRLKCAGSTGQPTFDHDAFPAIHKASQGIPRRINRLCDRLLLLGFMGRTHLTLADVKEVLRTSPRRARCRAATTASWTRAMTACRRACRTAAHAARGRQRPAAAGHEQAQAQQRRGRGPVQRDRRAQRGSPDRPPAAPGAQHDEAGRINLQTLALLQSSWTRSSADSGTTDMPMPPTRPPCAMR